MPKRSACLKVAKIYGENAIKLVNGMRIANKELKVIRDTDSLYIPLAVQPSQGELARLKEQFPDSKVLIQSFEEKKHPKTFMELLGGRLPPHLLASLPRALDFVGDIAIVEILPELDPYKSIIGEVILKTHGKVRTVLAKAGAISGTYRLREYEIIAGEPKTETIHKENGCQYHVDVSKAYFSPRLSYEHERVASLVKDGETVIDLFTGVGPFAILVAKTHENVEVHAVDVNPDAINSLKKNIRLNRVESRVHPILGDAKRITEKKLVGVADRVIMNLPEKALDFVDSACNALKTGCGMVHFYGFVSPSDSLEDMKLNFACAVERSERRVEQIVSSRLVRATAPYEWQAVLDAKIC